MENTDDEAPLDSPVALDAVPAPALHRHVEDLRERQALEQSMVSTLSGSRGGSLAASASAGSSSALSGSARSRDLRLSFPDPLTSPRNELNRSYDNVDFEDSLPGSPPQESAPAPERVIEPEAPVVVSGPAPPVRAVGHNASMFGDLQIVLYGDSREDKHVITGMVLGKLAEGLNLGLSGPDMDNAQGVIRYTLLKRGKVPSAVVRVVDNTNVFDPVRLSCPVGLMHANPNNCVFVCRLMATRVLRSRSYSFQRSSRRFLNTRSTSPSRRLSQPRSTQSQRIPYAQILNANGTHSRSPALSYSCGMSIRPHRR